MRPSLAQFMTQVSAGPKVARLRYGRPPVEPEYYYQVNGDDLDVNVRFTTTNVDSDSESESDSWAVIEAGPTNMNFNPATAELRRFI